MAMTYVGKKAVQKYTKKFLNQEMQKYVDKQPGGQWDPYFEYRPNKRGKLKKVKKQIPDYIPEHDALILAQVRKWAYRLNVKHSFMGTRFGWATIIGAVPEVGDAITVALALYVYSMCRKIDGGLDSQTKMKMKAWIVADATIGLIPFVGDIIDANIRCNARNCRILEEFLDAKYKPKAMRIEDERLTAERRKQNPRYNPPAPATVYEGYSDDEEHGHGHEQPPEYRTREATPAVSSGRDRIETSHRQETVMSEKPSKKRRGWGRK